MASTDVNYVFFYGHGVNTPLGYMSQWYRCNFSEGACDYCSAEQYMMHQKAKLFGDQEIADQIMRASNQRNIKALGRRVRNFEEKTWRANREIIVFNGNWLKFTQNPELKSQLLAYPEGTQFAEAAPRDRIWGIGFGARNALANKRRWGLNLLGKALSDVHSELCLLNNEPSEETLDLVEDDDFIEQVDQVAEPVDDSKKNDNLD